MTGFFAIFKGESGSGKSVAAYSFPNPFVFDFDQKMPSIAEKHFPGKKIDYEMFDSVFDVANKLTEFQKDCPYETLIGDSFTALVTLTMSSVGKIKGESIAKVLAPSSKSIDLMGIDYYNAEDRFATFFIEQLKKLWRQPGNPKHIILTAHVMTVESAPDLKTKIITRNRSIVTKGRKVAAWLPTEFDNMFMFGVEPPNLGDINQAPKRICITEAFGEDSAKCSYNFDTYIDFTKKSLFDELCKKVPSWRSEPPAL